MKITKALRRNHVTISYGGLCLLIVTAGLIEFVAPGSGLVTASRHSVLVGAIGGLVHLTVRVARWVSRRFLDKLIERVKGEVSVPVDSGSGL